MPPDATPLFRLYAGRRLKRLTRLDPAAAQRTELLALVNRARDTAFGRDHDFAGIGSVADFQQRVPLRRFEDFWERYWKDAFPVIEDRTWPGRVPYFAETSGTSTGRTKHIPVSREMARANRRATLDLISFHLDHRPDSRAIGGKNFMLGGNPRLNTLAPGVRSGDLTGIASREVPVWARPYYYPRGRLAEIQGWEEKVETQGRDSLGRDIRTIGGTASWLLLFFDRLTEIAGKPDGRLVDFYPNLDLVVYGGVNFAPYRDRFEDYLAGSHAEMREVYPASEGFIAVADRGPGEGLRLILDNGLFFEFVPVADLDSAAPRRYWIDTIETGVDYAVVLSTCAGCWGYVLGDTVRFVDLDPPRLLVTGRTAEQLSAFGEHLTGEELARAVAAGAEAIGAEVQDFTVAPLFPQSAEDPKGRHLYIVEFARPPGGGEAVLARFAETVDATLLDLNDDYGLHRSGGYGMHGPRVVVAPPGTFAAWMKARGKLGGQNKVPRVMSDPDLLASLQAHLPADHGEAAIP